MQSFYDLLKYAATGIASPDMTGFDKLRARAAFGGYPVSKITGVPPISFKSDGTPLTAWSIAGNGQQTGTPTPDAPIMPEFVGVRTGNLADTEKGGISLTDGSDSEYTNSKSQVRSGYSAFNAGETGYVSSNKFELQSVVAFYDSSKSYLSRTAGAALTEDSPSRSFTAPANTAFIRAMLYNNSTEQLHPFTDGAKIMLNSGPTALPYEPYGWAEKITCAGQTTPVYLGQTQTVRKIKKLVFDGTEEWQLAPADANEHAYLFLPIGDYGSLVVNQNISTHFPATVISIGNNNQGFACQNKTSQRHACVIFRYDGYTDTTDAWKSYLAAQYAAGTPVTVWYVLATPTTAIVNEPLCKIGDYADELHSADTTVTIPTAKGANVLTVDTDLQPSAVSVTGNIKAI